MKFPLTVQYWMSILLKFLFQINDMLQFVINFWVNYRASFPCHQLKCFPAENFCFAAEKFTMSSCNFCTKRRRKEWFRNVSLEILTPSINFPSLFASNNGWEYLLTVLEVIGQHFQWETVYDVGEPWRHKIVVNWWRKRNFISCHLWRKQRLNVSFFLVADNN